MRWLRASIGVAWAACVMLAASACAPPTGVQPWDAEPPSAEAGGPPAPRAAGNPRQASVAALDRILASPRLPAFDRSIYLSIRAYQLSRVGREADSRRDIDEMGRVLPAAWPVVLSGTVPELAGGGDRAAALRTLAAALERKPDDPWLLIAQAQVHMQIADFAQARVLLDRVLAAAATGSADRRSALYHRGHANFNLGRYQAAADDFAATLEGRSGRARLSPMLWRYAAQVRAGHDARATLARAVAGESLAEWPGALAAFLIGRLGEDELAVFAETDALARRANAWCPAALFVGLDALRRGDRRHARAQLQLAQARCPTTSEFNWAATSELERL